MINFGFVEHDLVYQAQPSEFYKRYGGREVPPLWTCATADDGIS